MTKLINSVLLLYEIVANIIIFLSIFKWPDVILSLDFLLIYFICLRVVANHIMYMGNLSF